MSHIPPPRATRDYLPEEAAARRYAVDRFVETVEAYGFEPIETPMFEKVELFSARSGPEIKASMLTFHADHEEFALRPELTAPICRVVAAGALDDAPQPYRLYYTGSCFRYTRPGSGRVREFTQAGLELLGDSSPDADAEIIATARRFLRSVGVDHFRLRVGTVGIFRALLPADMDPEDRTTVIGHLDLLAGIRERAEAVIAAGERAVIEELKIDRAEIAAMQQRSEYKGEYAVEKAPDLTGAELAERVPLEAEAAFRDVWSKEGLAPDDVAEKLLTLSRIRGPIADVVREAEPLVGDGPARAGLANLEAVCERLAAYGVSDLEVTLGLGRGLTFYTGVVFEIFDPKPGSGKMYCGGGRYDGLLELFGGEALPSVGCAFRFDTLLEAVAGGSLWRRRPATDIYFVVTNESDRKLATTVAEALRDHGVRVGVGPKSPGSGRSARTATVDGEAILFEDGRTMPLSVETLVELLVG
ncbi:MAG: hypothetical protein GC160_23755 [Acidobacteria bacterium]|nr:hypothetical protein [Acidobacteriota bacterium]